MIKNYKKLSSRLTKKSREDANLFEVNITFKYRSYHSIMISNMGLLDLKNKIEAILAVL